MFAPCACASGPCVRARACVRGGLFVFEVTRLALQVGSRRHLRPHSNPAYRPPKTKQNAFSNPSPTHPPPFFSARVLGADSLSQDVSHPTPVSRSFILVRQEPIFSSPTTKTTTTTTTTTKKQQQKLQLATCNAMDFAPQFPSFFPSADDFLVPTTSLTSPTFADYSAFDVCLL